MVYIVGYLVFTTAVVGYASAGTTYPSVCRHTLVLYHKKSVLSQRWPRSAPYIWMPWKFLGLPDYAHGYFSQNFMGFSSDCTVQKSVGEFL